MPQHAGAVLEVAHSQPSVSGAVAWLQSMKPVSQVYEHVVPLQAGLVALVGLQTSPQALQLLVVVSVVQVPPQVVAVQEHAPAVQVGVGWAQAVPAIHSPLLPQVCGTEPMHSTCPGVHTPAQPVVVQVWPWVVQLVGALHSPATHVEYSLLVHVVSVGEHTPVHPPEMHVWVPQSEGALQVPPALHVSTPLFTHWTAGGMHSTQELFRHRGVVPEQVVCVAQVPALHTWTTLPEHCVAPAAQVPKHALPTQLIAPQEVGDPQLPAELHSSKAVPLTHCVVPGAQSTQVLLRHTDAAPEQVVCVTQVPEASHVWMAGPRHCVWLGAQLPVHVPERHVLLPQSEGALQLPAALHISTPLFTHWVLLGVHATQVLLRHTEAAPEQVVVVAQLPVASHVWMALPRHCVVPAVQVPAHAPEMHVRLVQGTGALQLPEALHVSTPLFTHWVAGATHATQVLFSQRGVAPEQVVVVVQVPLALHDWTEVPEHRVWPGPHSPVHSFSMHVRFGGQG